MLSLPERLARRVLNASGLKSRHVPTRVGDIHVLEGAGGGGLPPIVVLHGFAAHAVCYAGLLKRFQPHVRSVIAPDMPGHGFSAQLRPGDPPTVLLDALTETLDRVLDQPAIILGNSMGGLVAIRYALARPHMVRGLALVSPGGAPLPPAQHAAFLERFRIDTYGQALEFVDDVFAKVPPLMRHPIAHNLRRRFNHPQLRQLLGEISPSVLLTPSELASLHMPVLFVWGREERILPRAHYRFFAQNLPAHAELVEFSDFGHIGFMEQPTALTQRVLDFARRLPAQEVSQHCSTCAPGHATFRASA
ncbi:alpha/beta fold hydrolase [Nannocystis radixulma]|uniref:Alpha/beta fold hydrolase n=1 Tax=Nannocystis radixulma TaxID=2995305 RepID=A0ABT5B811_9BACT|nr:alpha/beta fold hydrolase [Nannocystis radixulma]MDC0670261.1 alpha/beta fold hydrolase [Nannocystis radixulma]